MVKPETQFSRLMLRSAFQSMFWNVLLERKRETKFTLTALADKLGINKSYVSRSFSEPPNWQIDKISDMADALGVEIVLQARDKHTGLVFTPTGVSDRGAVTIAGGAVPSVAAAAGATGQLKQDGRTLLRAVVG